MTRPFCSSCRTRTGRPNRRLTRLHPENALIGFVGPGFDSLHLHSVLLRLTFGAMACAARAVERVRGSTGSSSPSIQARSMSAAEPFRWRGLAVRADWSLGVNVIVDRSVPINSPLTARRQGHRDSDEHEHRGNRGDHGPGESSRFHVIQSRSPIALLSDGFTSLSPVRGSGRWRYFPRRAT